MIPRARSVLVAYLVCLSLVSSSPALAQYMYLDSNGDGIHTAADQVNPAGPTTIDVWLDTANNRDGSPVVCAVAPSITVDLFGYVIALRASGGTVQWGTFTNLVPNVTIRFEHGATETEFADGYGLSAGSALPPGRHRLGTLSVGVAGGSPAIEIVPKTLTTESTSFGSHCYASEFDNTMTLGRDWFDVDGLPIGTDGQPNHLPEIQGLQDMVVATGELAFQPLTATDADNQPLTFSKVSSPAFLTVSNWPGTGTGNGSVSLAPLGTDAGHAVGTVSVTDGLGATQASFQIDVAQGPNHVPFLSAPEAITVVSGTTPQFPMYVADPDGQQVTFSKLDGPEYLKVSTLVTGAGGATGSFRLNPGPCDIGDAPATLQASDGIAAASKRVSIHVVPRRGAPPQPANLPIGAVTVLAAGDLDADGHMDVVGGGPGPRFRSFLGKGDGTLVPATVFTLGTNGEVGSIQLGDWNSDGHLDAALVVLGATQSELLVVLGRGDGGFDAPTAYIVEGFPWIVRAADLDRDGDQDLVVTHGSGFGVLLGNGDGSFGTLTDYLMGANPRGLALADFNGDGRTDAVTANLSSQDLSIRFGLGNGTFGDPTSIPFDRRLFDLVAADWNHDGRMDLATTDFLDGTVQTYLGDGAGGFAFKTEVSGFGINQALAVDDLDGDGNYDLVVNSEPPPNGPSLSVLYGKDDGTFSPKRAISSIGQIDAVTADFNEDGFPDIASGFEGPWLWLNDAGGAGMPEARAFSESNAPSGGKPTTCVRLEPVAASYRNDQVDPTSLTLTPESGAGTIHAITTKSAVVGDTDGNGIAEIPACFSRDDLSALFDAARGRQTVTAHVQGALVDGRAFCASVSLDIIGTGKKLAASVSPNPLNPGGILRLTTSRDGFVRVRLFDLHGRVVRTLEDRPMVPAGAHDVRIDGRNTAGQTLASGVYFYQVETVEGSLRGRITVLK